MLVRCWGSRGTIPVNGSSFSKYGGETTCIEVRPDDETVLIFDAGSGIRRLGQRLLQENKLRYHLFFTHTHIDHIVGFISFYPFFNPEATIDIYAPILDGRPIESILADFLAPPWSPFTLGQIKARLKFHTISSPITCGKTLIESIPLNHPGGGNGYKVIYNQKKFVLLTDNELADSNHPLPRDDYITFSHKADLLFHDAAYNKEEYKTRQNWGHSTWNAALQLALDAEVLSLGIFHHNQERNDKEIDQIITDCQALIQKSGSSLNCFAVAADSIIQI